MGHYVVPTIFTDVAADAAIMREEIFGPVLTFTPFDTEEEAIRLANDTAFGLAATVWTHDISRAHRLASAVRAGTINVRSAAVTKGGAAFAHAAEPYGQSGFGAEGGLAGLASYTVLKSIQMHLG